MKLAVVPRGRASKLEAAFSSSFPRVMSNAASASENPYMPPRAEPPLRATLVAEAADGGTEFALHASGNLSLDDGKRIHRMLGGGILRQVILFVVLAVTLFVLFNLVMRDPLLGFTRGLPVALLVVLLLAACLLTINVAPIFHLKRQCRQQTGIFQPQQFVFTDEAVVVKTELVETRLKWAAFHQFKGDDDVMLIYLSPPTSFFVVPRSFFASDDQWTLFRQLVHRNVAGG